METLTLGWLLYSIGTFLEIIVLSIHVSKHLRFVASAVVLLVTATGHTFLLASKPSIGYMVIFTIGLYRMYNIIRFGYGRMHETYLYRATGRTSLWLGCIQAIAIAIIWGLGEVEGLARILSAVSVFGMATFIALLLFALRSGVTASAFISPQKHFADSELPSVTVAIPARNETQDLADCIKSFVDSSYKKLEIVVLDDCSQDKTSDIIKHFAHDGVRFVQGTEPGDVWLPKNAAYEKLLQEANGDYILFCGVDVRVNTDTVRQLLTFMLASDLQMISVLPTRSDYSSKISISQFVRYIWELALPRRILGSRPPVLSTLWCIKRQSLLENGGFKAVTRMVVPEAYFAKQMSSKDVYRFVRSSNDLIVESIKSRHEQTQTAVRVRYPQLHKRPENVLLLTIGEILLLVHPLLLLPFGIATMLIYGTVMVLVCVFAAWFLVNNVTKGNRIIHTVQVLLSVPYDLLLLHVSMYKYEFSHIDWKDRNVCLPVMHVYPSLPKID